MKKAALVFATVMLVGCIQPINPPECPQLEKPMVALKHLTYNQITVGIVDTSNADHYILWRNSEEHLIDYYLKTTGDVVDQNVVSGETYQYWVNSYSIDKAGNASDTLVITVPRDPKPHDFAEAKATFIGSNSVFLEWENVDDIIDYYAVMRDGEQIGATQKRNYLDVAAPAGQLVTYRIIAVNEFGQTASQDIQIETPIAVLESPQNLTVANRDFKSIGLAWDELPGCDLYTIEFDGIKYNVLTPYVTIDSLKIASHYAFVVYGNNKFGPGERAVIETKTKGQYLAIWAPNIEEDLAGYKIFNAKDDRLAFTIQGTDTSYIFIIGGEEFPDIEPPLAKLKAFDASGNESGFSETAYAE